MLRVVQMRLGPLGQKNVKHERSGIMYVGAVDPAKDKVGKDLGRLCGRKPLGVVGDIIDPLIHREQGDKIVIHGY